MRRIYFAVLLLRDLVGYCVAHRTVWPLLLISVLFFLVGLIAVAAVCAPFIYTMY